MDIKGNYTWEAERSDGSILREGGDLSGCVRFSLIPPPGRPLPRHDIVGLPMVRRFCRNHTKVRFAGREELPGVVFWMDGERELQTSEDLTGHISIGEYVGKGVAGEDWYQVVDVFTDSILLMSPYKGISKPKGLPGRKLSPEALSTQGKYLHCIETNHSRIWVDYESGAVLVTAKDVELYL